VEIDRLGDYADTSEDLQRSDVPGRKRPRLETENTSHATTVALQPYDAPGADLDPVMDAHPNASGTLANCQTPGEDANLTRAVTKTQELLLKSFAL
jgi:hypothetical protein